MKKLLLLIVGIAIGAFAMYVLTPMQPSAAMISGPVTYNCELSGGTMKAGACTCPLENGQTQAEMYDKQTGFCQSSMGGPAGEAFFASIGLPRGEYSYWNEIMQNLCTESGGTLSGAACICPEGDEFSKDTGRCE